MPTARDEPSSDFLALPAELRLNIYSYLISPCLTEGLTDDIHGLYFTCRQIQAEMEAEHLRKLRPLLMAKREWEKIVHYVPAMEFHLDTIQAKHLDNTALTLRIPVLAPWVSGSLAGNIKSFQAMVEGVRPIFNMPWSTLTVDFYASQSTLKTFWGVEQVLKSFFRVLVPTNRNSPALQQTKRLVLVLPDNPLMELSEILRTFRDFFAFMRRRLRGSNGEARVRQGWCFARPATKDEQWHLTLDFSEDLEVPERAKYMIDKGGVRT